jgi:hypothetical protein
VTATTHPATDQVRRLTLRAVVRRSAATVAALVQKLRTEIADVAAAGQLGPDVDAEMGRWTGARV